MRLWSPQDLPDRRGSFSVESATARIGQLGDTQQLLAVRALLVGVPVDRVGRMYRPRQGIILSDMIRIASLFVLPSWRERL